MELAKGLFTRVATANPDGARLLILGNPLLDQPNGMSAFERFWRWTGVDGPPTMPTRGKVSLGVCRGGGDSRDRAARSVCRRSAGGQIRGFGVSSGAAPAELDLAAG